ncbi:hypothetical protein AB4K20DRAFT_1950256 [Rhizopus microsporus]
MKMKSTQDIKLIRDHVRANLDSMMYSETQEVFDLAHQLFLAYFNSLWLSRRQTTPFSSADQNVRILLTKYNEKIKQLKDNSEGSANLVSAFKQSKSTVENVCYMSQSRPARQQ